MQLSSLWIFPCSRRNQWKRTIWNVKWLKLPVPWKTVKSAWHVEVKNYRHLTFRKMKCGNDYFKAAGVLRQKLSNIYFSFLRLLREKCSFE